MAVRTAAAAAVIEVEVVRAMMVGCRRGRSPDHQQSHGDGIPEGHFPSENGQRGGRPPLSPLGPTCVRAIDKDCEVLSLVPHCIPIRKALWLSDHRAESETCPRFFVEGVSSTCTTMGRGILLTANLPIKRPPAIS